MIIEKYLFLINFRLKMSKLIFFLLFFHFIKIQNTKRINVEIKIVDWEDKRQYLYLKNIKERFVLKTRERCRDDSIIYPRQLVFNIDSNIFNAETSTVSKYRQDVQLSKKILIEIAKHSIIQKILPKLEKQVF